MIAIFFFVLLFTFNNTILSQESEHIKINLKDLIKKIDNTNTAIMHQKILGYASNDSFEFITKKITIDKTEIIRSTPLIQGIPVEGVDGIYIKNSPYKNFFYTNFAVPKSKFLLTPAQALTLAIPLVKNALLTDPFTENIEGAYEKIWLLHFDEMKSAYKVRVPTLSVFDLKDIYIDAEYGSILKIEASAQLHFAYADAFVYSPKSNRINAKDLSLVKLNNLMDIKEGDFLRSELFEIKNCCKYYTCPSDDTCSDEEKRCALKSHENVMQSREELKLATSSMGLDPSLNIPETIYVDTVRCTHLPFAKAMMKNNKLGFFDKPIDDYTEESERDRFSEIQVYFSISSFFERIRTLLNDHTWCLREEAMSCDENGKLILDEKGHPKNPYRVFVNQMVPNLESTSLTSPKTLRDQVKEGKGTKQNPIIIDTFSRLGNAAFVPALSSIDQSTPKANEILNGLIKNYDHNVFFQGNRDFAYDGHVVFHEFMHAIISSLVGKLNSLGVDKWGIHSETGSLNEGWADYFAGSMNDDPLIGRYASKQEGYDEVSLRSILNDFSCPQDVIGEVHNDSQIWSGALWEVRALIAANFDEEKTLEFDRAVLTALAQAKKTEDFNSQAEKLLIALQNSLGDEIKKIAEKVFEKRGVINCFRAFTLSSVDKQNKVTLQTKKTLFMPPKEIIGLKNYAPAAIQFEIGVPAGATEMKLSWKQYFASTLAINNAENEVTNQKGIEPLIALYKVDEPISWDFKDAIAKPVSREESADKNFNDSPSQAVYVNDRWYVNKKLDFDKCEQKTIYVALAGKDLKYILEDITIDFNVDKSLDISGCNLKGSIRGKKKNDGYGCSSINNQNFLLALLILFSFKAARRKNS